MLRGQKLFLLPGVRRRIGALPSLPWMAAEDAPVVEPVDPMANRAPLPPPVRIRPEDPLLQRRRGGERDRIPKQGESAPWVVRTALCVEPRNGVLHVFMPPAPITEDTSS
jgi:uncharacterized protein (DUF2126 family)